MIHVDPGRKYPLAPGVLSAVEKLIQNLDSQMGHTDLIQIRKAHDKPDRNVSVLSHRVHFITQIPRRLLNLQQKFVRQSRFSKIHIHVL